MSYKQIACNAAAQSAATGEDKTNLIVRTAAKNTKHKEAGYKPINIPSFDEGGTVEGEVGEPKLILAHGQEEVLKPEDAEAYRAQQSTMKPLGAPQSKPSNGRIEPTTAESTEQLIQPRDTTKEEPKPTLGGTVAKQWLKSVGVPEPSTSESTETQVTPRLISTEEAPAMRDVIPSRTAQQAVAGYPKILLADEKPLPVTRDMAGDVVGSGVLAPIGFKATLAKLKQDHTNALAERSPEGQEKAERIEAQMQDLQKNNPWGSAGNHPGLLGKIGHVAEMVASRAPGIAPIMMTIPGSEGYRAAERTGTQERLKEDTAANTAREVAEAKEAPKEATLHELSGGAVDPQHPELGRQQALYNEKTGEISYKGPAKPEKLAANETPANDTQITEAAAQLPAITRALSSDERKVFQFPAGYKPTVAEIKANNELAGKANAQKLAGNRDATATAAAQAAANKRTMEEKMVEQIAKDIAPMDVNSLSQLKNITSMRSDQRSLIYARAKELNPDFNTAEVDRKVKMLDNFTNGKDGQSLQSFGTFLEHAGDANQVVQNIRNGVTPQILNVPLNALEKHGWGTTATQLSAALEPVRKEFEGFLLGGRALYAEDRKAAEAILSDSSTPAQVQAALKQMAHTVSARYNEMDNRFKNTMKVDITKGIGPLSDAAFNGAEAIGVKELGGKTLRDGKHGYGWYNTSTEEK